MSREIKFRAWDKKRNKFIKVGRLAWFNNGVNVFEKFQTNGMDLNNCVLEQFTGLKDKNGKDIYEGDLLKAKIEDSWQATPLLG